MRPDGQRVTWVPHTIGSLFSGIGGLELGLEWATGAEVRWQVELDPWCRKVLAKHWPKAVRHEDVRAVGASNLEPVDIICGGFPCTDISNAGGRAGIKGKQSGLWFEYARIVRELRPRIVVVENVSALLARGMGDVLGGLAALGYDAEWLCVRASDVGAPHRRERVFVVAHANSAGLRNESGRGGSGPSRSRAPLVEHHGEALADSDSDSDRREGERRGELLDGERPPQRDDVDGCRGEAVADTDGAPWQRQERETAEPGAWPGEARRRAAESRRHGFGEWPPRPDELHLWAQLPPHTQPAIRRCTDGISAGLVRTRGKQLAALGNAVVPAVAEVVGRVVMEIAGRLSHLSQKIAPKQDETTTSG